MKKMRIAATGLRVALFVALFMTPVALFSAAHAENGKGKINNAGIVILVGLQRNA